MSDKKDQRFKLYVGHKLTNASEHFNTKMALMKQALEVGLAGKFRILKFLGLDGTPPDIYDRDITECVGTCDLFVAIVDDESTGLGFELGAALFLYGAPILVIYHRSRYVSKLIRGAVERNSGNMREVVVDDNVIDITPIVLEAVEWFGLHKRRAGRLAPRREPGDGWPLSIDDGGVPAVIEPTRP